MSKGAATDLAPVGSPVAGGYPLSKGPQREPHEHVAPLADVPHLITLRVACVFVCCLFASRVFVFLFVCLLIRCLLGVCLLLLCCCMLLGCWLFV